MTSLRDSARFEVDTTPPRIDGLRASVEGSQIHVTFRAADGFSNIKRAEYSLDAGDWQYVEPVGQLADSKSASYDFLAAVPLPRESQAYAPVENPLHPPRETKTTPAEHVVVVRVYDRFDNMASAKTVIRSK